MCDYLLVVFLLGYPPDRLESLSNLDNSIALLPCLSVSNGSNSNYRASSSSLHHGGSQYVVYPFDCLHYKSKMNSRLYYLVWTIKTNRFFNVNYNSEVLPSETPPMNGTHSREPIGFCIPQQHSLWFGNRMSMLFGRTSQWFREHDLQSIRTGTRVRPYSQREHRKNKLSKDHRRRYQINLEINSSDCLE